MELKLSISNDNVKVGDLKLGRFYLIKRKEEYAIMILSQESILVFEPNLDTRIILYRQEHILKDALEVAKITLLRDIDDEVKLTYEISP